LQSFFLSYTYISIGQVHVFSVFLDATRIPENEIQTCLSTNGMKDMRGIERTLIG